jgi:hypothetical protein
MRRPIRRAASLRVPITGAIAGHPQAGSPRPLQPEWVRVALPGGSAETALPGASAELPRGGSALFWPLDGGVNDGGFPDPVWAGAPDGAVGWG